MIQLYKLYYSTYFRQMQVMFFKKRKVCELVLTSAALCAIIHHADTETCRCGVIGRRSGLKIRRSKIRTGSSPVSGNNIAEWSSPVARWAHNPKVAGSNPASAIKKQLVLVQNRLFFALFGAKVEERGNFIPLEYSQIHIDAARSQPLPRRQNACGAFFLLFIGDDANTAGKI